MTKNEIVTSQDYFEARLKDLLYSKKKIRYRKQRTKELIAMFPQYTVPDAWKSKLNTLIK